MIELVKYMHTTHDFAYVLPGSICRMQLREGLVGTGRPMVGISHVYQTTGFT